MSGGVTHDTPTPIPGGIAVEYPPTRPLGLSYLSISDQQTPSPLTLRKFESIHYPLDKFQVLQIRQEQLRSTLIGWGLDERAKTRPLIECCYGMRDWIHSSPDPKLRSRPRFRPRVLLGAPEHGSGIILLRRLHSDSVVSTQPYSMIRRSKRRLPVARLRPPAMSSKLDLICPTCADRASDQTTTADTPDSVRSPSLHTPSVTSERTFEPAQIPPSWYLHESSQPNTHRHEISSRCTLCARIS